MTESYFVIVSSERALRTMWVHKIYGKANQLHNAKKFDTREAAEAEAKKYKFGRVETVRHY